MLINDRSTAQSSEAQSSAVQSSTSQSSSAHGTMTSTGSSTTTSSSSSTTGETTVSSALSITTTDSAGHTITTAPSMLTQQVTSTDAAGKVYTITQIVHNPSSTGTSSAADDHSGFFSNSGAVAGTFVAVGLVATTGIMAFVIFMLRRRRRQRLDRDVSAAASAAAAAAAHSRSAYDDEDDQPSMAQYGHYYAVSTPSNTDIHNQPQPEMGPYHDYEDPAGGYDPYAVNMVNLAPSNERLSTSTEPGMAGFGATSAQANYAVQAPYAQDPNGQEYIAEPHQPDFSMPVHEQQAASEGYYFDSSQAYAYAQEDAYGGFHDNTQDQYIPEQPAAVHRRNGSDGSVSRSGGERGLKVTNF